MSLRRKILLGLMAVLLLVPSAMMYVVVTTESGLQFVVSRLSRVGPVTLTPGRVTGTLAGGFTIESLRIQHRLSDVHLDRASAKIELWPLLLLQRVTLPDVALGQLHVTMLSDPVQRAPQTPRFLPALLRIDADNVRIDALDVTLVSGRTVEFRNIDGSATVFPTQIRVHDAQLDFELARIQASGRVHAARPIALEGDAEILWRPDNQPEWLITARFDGDLDRLPLTGRIERPFKASVAGDATTLNTGWQFAGRTDVEDFNLEPFGGGEALGLIAGQLDVTADRDGYTAKGTANPAGLRAGGFDVDFTGAYADRNLDIERATVIHQQSGARATTTGSVQLVSGGPQLDLRGDWTRFRWPLTGGEPAFSSPQGRYTLSGIKPWAVTLDGEVIAAGQPAMPATMQGALNTESLQINEGSLQLFGGTATAAGEARWKPVESWRVQGRMTGLDPANFREDLTGNLDFDFVAGGTPFGEEGNIDFDVSRVAGTLRDQPLSGKGQFARAGGREDWQFSEVDLRLGRTQLQLDGSLGEQSDLRFAIDADDLSLFDPEARGRISARGRYAGTRAEPVLLFKARGAGFEWQGRKLAELDADIDLDLGPDGHAQGQFELTRLELGARTLQQVSVQLSGTGAQQRLAINLDASPMRAALVAQGGMREGLWDGTLQSLIIEDAANLQLRLEAPSAFAVNLSQFELAQTCVKGSQERLCLQGAMLTDGTWNAELDAESLPLRALTAGLTQNVDYEGTINLEARLAGHRTGLPTGSVRGELQQALLRHRLSNGREERLSLGSGSIAANAMVNAFDVQVGLDAGEAGSIKGELNGERNAGPWHDFPIRGSLDATTDGLGMLDIYFGGIDRATGRLITKVGIGGTLGAPTVQGLLQLRDASIDIYQVNLMMRELSLDANFNTESLDISGSSKLGNGTAKFNGKLAWRDGDPYGDLHVEGENLRVVDIPEARIEASPNLDFKIAGRRIDATGEVRIPSARLEPADLANAVLPSGDEVMVGAEAVDPAQRWLVVSDIRVVMGDQVRLNTLGLTANLGGSIAVRTDEAQVSRGQGELNISDGRYSALGRLLDIERGRLIFNNVPLGDPGIDMRAQKVYPDITAGVNVRGSLRAPRMTFFSEPAIPQSQIASLILAGGSLESVQNGNSSGAARNDLLAQGGAILAQRVGTAIGVDDVGIESDLSNDTSLVLGKYLSPRLYVSYGVSLAEAINTLKMRFTIGDRWTIKTEAGKARSADIVYTIQK